MIALMSSPEVPELYSSIASHYLFEFIHPFYDGNGRAGRYLLATGLCSPLSVATTLSLSRTIAAHRDAYYRAFRITEDPLNHGELTHFVITMMELIGEAQEQVIGDLELRKSRLEEARGLVHAAIEEHVLQEKEADIIFQLLQVTLFGVSGEARLTEIASHVHVGPQMARKYVKKLEDCGLVLRSGTNPTRFTLSPSLLELLGESERDSGLTN